MSTEITPAEQALVNEVLKTSTVNLTGIVRKANTGTTVQDPRIMFQVNQGLKDYFDTRFDNLYGPNARGSKYRKVMEYALTELKGSIELLKNPPVGVTKEQVQQAVSTVEKYLG